MNEAIKILIIDDSEDDRMLYRRTLLKGGDKCYNISEASDGEDGLKYIDEEEPTCILLDYSLPGHNGIEILKRIRDKYPFIPVVMLTGQGNENVAVSAMQEGAQNYISKSTITPEILDHVIRMACEHCTMQKRIHEQRTSLEVFTHALAHDLKEPVRTIRSFAELLAGQDTFSEKARGYFQHIQNAADRMHMLIDTVFLYTRLDDPGKMVKDVCDTNTVLQEVMENLDRLIHERSAIVTSGAVLPKIYVNRTQLMQVLQNLVSNAIRHSEKAVTIRIHAEELTDSWLFHVSDNGPGIDEAYLQKIFEPFKRLAHHEVEGAGLGLATCRKIVESHGGKIWCKSQQGGGATFLFTIPKALPNKVTNDNSEFSAPPSEKPSINPLQENNDKSLANVLLVDDSRADIEITQFRLIEVPGVRCNFLVARNGKEALTLLQDKIKKNEQIDLMLVDINMPEMDGFELLEKMRTNDKLGQIPVVMCTGSTNDKDMQRADKLGAIGYLVKPAEFNKLKDIIDENTIVRLCQENTGYSLLRAA